ncbi:MAG: AAA family ATPase [Flammeovirgaceae bacterium]
MHRISKLTLKNFKFFHGEVPINFEGKNILLYGENGSGKSSIYWALYTFLQSVFKTEPQQVVKYFAHNHPENLRNRYANDDESSAIVIEFNDGVKRSISNDGIIIKQNADDNLVLEATLGSDLIEYRTLSRIYHFAHSEEVDLFPFFQGNLLPFISFSKVFTKHDNSAGTKNAQDFWEYISTDINIFKNASEDKTYEIFSSIVELFNAEFENYLNTIAESVNEYLNDDFEQNIKVGLRYVKAKAVEKLMPEDGKIISTESPQIILDVWLTSDKIPEGRKKIFNPQSFLNESKLTALALSIRLAILDEKFVEEYPKILVLDDFLMSMDMSNREAVLEVILNNYLDDYQILFFTHQRGLFEDAKKFIELYHADILRESGESNPEVLNAEWLNHWKVFEMYETENDLKYSVLGCFF